MQFWNRVEVSCGFLLLMAWLNFTDTDHLLPLVVCAAAAHEAGHWAAIRLCGGGVERLRLTAVGVQMQVVGTLSYPAELLCALSGPAVNLLLFVLCAERGQVFSGINLALGSFNLLPLSPLDGGRALSALCAQLADPDRADRVLGIVDALLTGLLLTGGLAAFGTGGGLTLLAVGGWLLWRRWKIGGKKGCHRQRERVK